MTGCASAGLVRLFMSASPMTVSDIAKGSHALGFLISVRKYMFTCQDNSVMRLRFVTLLS